MSEYSPEFSNIPDIATLLHQRIANKQAEEMPFKRPSSTLNPHSIMVKKHRIERGEELPEIPEANQWPVEDVKALQDYCQKMGIVGFSTRQSPKLALMQLQKQMGDFSNISVENRVPAGYEKIESNSSKKSLIRG